MTIHDVYNVDGLLKQKFPEYQIREGQVHMSELVERAIREKRSAVVEGPTGIGKGFAYLIPAIISQKPVIISTSNKSLQDQLDKKDLPTLQSVFGEKLSWSVLKGKSNYFCFEHFQTNEKELIISLLPAQGGEKEYDHAKLILQQVAQWVDDDGIGDLEYCPIELSQKTRELLCCDNAAVHEKDSDGAKGCYATRARERAKSSQIILVNHSLLALDMNLRRKSGGKISFLPDVETVIIDEAHEFEKSAILAFSDEISIYSLIHLLNWTIVKNSFPKAKRKNLFDGFQVILNSYLPSRGNRGYYIQQKVESFVGLEEVVEGIDGILHSLSQLEQASGSKGEIQIKQITKEAETLQERLKEISEDDPNSLRWSEAKDNAKGEPNVKLKTVPLDISPLIKFGLFENGKNVIACSATLAVSNSFSYFREQIGMPSDSLELIVPSPFDYKTQSLVYISDGSQDPYYEMTELLRMSKGRAFLLFTSYSEMELAYQMVQSPHPKLIQSRNIPRSQILEEFKNQPNAILFATKSFWEGVDIKGDKLSLVIIRKIPFEVPSNLIFQAKSERVDAKYGTRQSFVRLSIPDACIKLKQGSGRLIRSTTDKGVVALLDTRVNVKPYGKAVIESLPPTYRTQQLEKVEKFFSNIDT